MMLRILLLLFMVSPAAANAEAPQPAAVLSRMREAQSNLTSLTARLEQVKSFPQLGIEDPAERGRFYMARSKRGTMRVRMEIQEPAPRILTVANGRYVLYQPRINQALEGAVTGGGQKGLFSGILTGNPEAVAELELDYVASSRGEMSVVGEDVILLRFDARADTAVYCHRIDLWVSRSTWLPVQQSCHEANQSVITFTLSSVETDVPIDDETFELELPDGVERVRG